LYIHKARTKNWEYTDPWINPEDEEEQKYFLPQEGEMKTT
jgi:hypothetical protein